ncbi:MAG: S8/S53 family peptidase, partial [Holosporales bacterium]|nr:S8/S53 family peptidase [Holosporales bacterium]
MWGDLIGVGGAHRSGICGQGQTIVIFESGPYLKDETEKAFPGRSRLEEDEGTLGLKMPDPSHFGSLKDKDRTHSFNVTQCADTVAPQALFSFCHAPTKGGLSDRWNRRDVLANRKRPIINESMAPVRDTGDSDTLDIRHARNRQFSENEKIIKDGGVLVTMAAGNDTGYPCCNLVEGTDGTAKKLTELGGNKGSNIFFVGDITYSSSGSATLHSCYPEDGEKDRHYLVVCAGGSGSSFAAPQCAGWFALLLSRWNLEAYAAARLMVETADLVPVEYEPKYDADGKAIASPKKITGKFRRPNLQKALNFDEKTATLCGIPWSETAVHSSAAFGDAFRRCGLQQALWVDPYGRSWSGVTDAEADVSRCVVLAQESSFQSVAEWFS